MNWDAVGAIAELVGALAVVLTLFFLAIQVRHSIRVTEESNRLNRASALDRHTDSIGKWRHAMASNPDLANLWRKAQQDEPMTDVESLRMNNLWVTFVNIQRSNFIRARTVGEDGLARQSYLSVANEATASARLLAEWEQSRPWHSLASPEFVKEVDAIIQDGGIDMHRPGDSMDSYVEAATGLNSRGE